MPMYLNERHIAWFRRNRSVFSISLNTYIVATATGLLVLTSSFAADRAHFEGKLKLEDVAAEYVNSGPYDPGHTEFKLIEDYTFIDHQGQRWTAPKGAVVNGASIPKALWSIIGGPWDGEYRNASVIHDYMCEELIESSAFTHRLFFEALIASNVSEKLAKLMYFAVKKGGPKWEKKPGFLPPIVTRDNVSTEELEAAEERINRENPSLDELDRLARQ